MTKIENEIIAEFMGIVFWKQINGQKYYKVPKEHVYVNNANLGQFRYDKSWDWLMPVVEAIEEIELPHPSNNPEKGTVWPFQFEILSRNQVQIIDNRNDEAIVTTGTPEGCKTKIESVYRAVVEFIKWYNENNQS